MRQDNRQDGKKLLFSVAAAIGLWILAGFFGGLIFQTYFGREEKSKDQRPLAFFDIMCHDENGFDFDGFFLQDNYELFEKRLAVTKGARKPEITTWTECEYKGTITRVRFPEIRLKAYPGARGEVIYQFYEGQFLEGSLCVIFPSYQEAKEYVQKRMEAVSGYRDKKYQERQEQYGITDGGWWTWETGEEGRTYEGRYVDRQHTCLSFFAEETSEEEGYAKIQFGESINREYADGRAASRYFSFEDTEDSEFCLESPPQVYIEYSLEELCGESTAIVKASYVSRTELDLFLGIHVFKLEKDFIGNIEETYLHLYGEGRKRFEKGESYYLFLREDPSPLYPHIVYHLTGSVDGYQKEEENISPAIKEEVKKGNYSVKEEEKTVEEDYQNADLIYRVKITGVEALNPFEQGCSGEISEVIRAR